MILIRYLCVLFLCCVSFPAKAEERVVRIYQDADLSHHIESSKAIQMGIETALSETDNMAGGYKVEVSYLNHRGNVVRSKQNYKKFLADEKGLVIFSGLHSPPLIKNRTFINEKKALTLVPWAAGGPITRFPSRENWVFRLSVDDTRAGPVIIDFAIKSKKCRQPHLLLEGSPWGESNLRSMSKALKQHNINTPKVTRFSWNLKDQGARILMREILKTGADCIILVGNAIEGAKITQALIDVKGNKKINLISHWGITGGKFHEEITSEKREKIDISFIQSCFAFTNKTKTDFSNQVFDRLKIISNGKIKAPKDLRSAVGFIHAYDLTKVLVAAINQAGLTGDMAKDRNAVRLALENLKQPVKGLVKTYDKPFSVFDAKSNVNAHEALHSENYCMGRFGPNDEVLLIGAQ